MLLTPPGPPLMAMLSSPVRMKVWVMVMFLAPLPGSMPSVLRARRLGVSIFTPQTVKPSPPL